MMKAGKNRIVAVLALLAGAIIGVVLGFLYEPNFNQDSKPSDPEQATKNKPGVD